MKTFKNHPSLRAEALRAAKGQRSNPTLPRYHQDCHGTTSFAMTIRRILKSEAGYALAMALVLLLFGGFFVVPCLNLLYTSLNANIMVDERDLELYAADAGIDYALWYVQDDVENNGGAGLPAQSDEDTLADLPDETINNRTLNVTISNEGEDGYKITSIATSADGDSTTIECYISLLDFSWLFENAITSPGEVSLKKGVEVIGDVTSPNAPTGQGTYEDWEQDTGLGDIWPDVDVLSDYYLGQGNLTPYTSSSIDIKDTQNIGNIKTDGALSINNSDAPDTLQLTGTIYVTGNLAFEQPGQAHDYTIDLNGQTIFAYDGDSEGENENKATITFASGCTIIGSGCIIAEGDIIFSPNIGTGDKLVGVTDSTVDSSALANTFLLSRFTSESDGTVTTFNVECSGPGNVKVAIYEDNGSGEPGNRLEYINDSQAVVKGWNTITLDAPIDVTEGTYYWLAANSDAEIIGVYNKEGENNRHKSASYSTFTFPDPAGTGFAEQTTEQYAFACYSAGAPPGFVFIMSIEGMSYISPTKGSLYGSVAGFAEVELKGKATLELIDLPDDGLNFPGSDDSGTTSPVNILTYTIE